MPSKTQLRATIEIWSVVHLPCALMSSLAPVIFLPSQAGKGANNCKRLEVGDTTAHYHRLQELGNLGRLQQILW